MLAEAWNDIRYRIRAFVHRDAADRDLQAEFEDHLAREVEALIRAGRSPADATREARLAFGGLEAIKEHTRDAWGTALMGSLIQDMRYGVRQLRRHPAFASSAILVLALGIASPTVIFSIVYGVLLRALPYDQPDRLVTLGSAPRAAGFQSAYAGAADYFDWRKQQQAFEELGLTRPVANYNLTGVGEPERLQGARTTASLFSTLRARPFLGRTYTEDEQLDPSKAASVAVLSYGLWQRRFGGDRSIVGRSLLLNGTATEVVGVMGPDFQYPSREFELWTPLYIPPDQLKERHDFSYLCVARLKPGVSVEQSRADMDVVAANVAHAHPQLNTGVVVIVQPMLTDITGSVQRAVLVLLTAVGVLYLAACVNLANLLLVRATVRTGEFSLRASLGATRPRLARQFFAEAIPLAIAGALLGIVAAHWLLALLLPLLPSSMPRIGEIGLHVPVLATSVALSVAAAFFVALAPAAQVRSSLERGPAAHGRARKLFIVAELTCTVLLLVTAGLLIRSFSQLRATDPGFRPTGVLSLQLAVNRVTHGDDQGVARYLGQLIDSVRAVPGVEAVGIVNRLPLGGQLQAGAIQFEGNDTRFDTDWRSVSGDFFRALNVPIYEGRSFTDADSTDRPAVGTIDERLARAAFPGGRAIGKRFRMMDVPEAPWIEVVGVVGHVRQEGLDTDPRPQVYWPYQQRTQDRTAMVVRTTVEPSSLTTAVRAAINEIDPDQPLYDVWTMPAVVSRTLRGQWLNTVLMGAFAFMGLALTTAGLYGVVSYLTAQRRREIGIRLALGAQASDVRALVLRQGVGLTVMGLAVGLLLSAALTRVLGSMLHGVNAWDAATYLSVTGLLLTVVVVATIVPAWRASRLDPKTALQEQ